MRCECGRDRSGFRLPGRRPRASDHRDFVEYDGGVLDEHAIGQVRRGRQPPHLGAQAGKHRFVGLVLAPCARDVEGFTHEMGQFAVRQGRTDFACVSEQGHAGAVCGRGGRAPARDLVRCTVQAWTWIIRVTFDGVGAGQPASCATRMIVWLVSKYTCQ